MKNNKIYNFITENLITLFITSKILKVYYFCFVFFSFFVLFFYKVGEVLDLSMLDEK